MTKKTTRREQYSDLRGTLYLAFELGLKEWKLGFSIGLGQKARRRTIPGGDLEKLVREIAAAKKRFELSETAPVVSCYEAGRDGFRLDRYLTQSGVDRKSTCLNSSHRCISYAVFCLKKKNKVKTERN